MTAGHLVILSLIGLIFSFSQMFGSSFGYGVAPVSVAFSHFIYLLEILVAFIQAYIFTMLSALFIGMAVAEHAHEHEHEYTEGVLPEYTVENHSEVTPHPLRPQASLGQGH
jgi:F-type H+-transporting ATPase subunit a